MSSQLNGVDMDLVLPLKGTYFDDIKAGRKPEEYRLCTPYWKKRIEGRCYERVVFTRGYPRRDDECRRFALPWEGYSIKSIVHPEFGDQPVMVYAIKAAHV